MGDFSRCIDPILAEEGGLSNHPDDPGGLTQYGISQHSYPALNIAELTLANAQALYRRDYWQLIQGDQLPDGLDLLMLDCAINQGPATAIKLLQQALKIRADGIIGPQTLSATAAAMPDLLDTFTVERAMRYAYNANLASFGRGWYRRLLRILRQARERVTP